MYINYVIYIYLSRKNQKKTVLGGDRFFGKRTFLKCPKSLWPFRNGKLFFGKSGFPWRCSEN